MATFRQRRERLSRRDRRRCPHSDLRAIWGDEILQAGGRIWCTRCNRTLDGPPQLAELRKDEPR